MDLSEKIKLILASKNLSPSIFADEIGVQRPSISHILAGRNKPSLDIVQKIVKRFPDLGLNWILDDEELNIKSSDTTGSASETLSQKTAKKDASGNALDLNVPIQAHQAPVYENLITHNIVEKPEKKVEKIVLFYSDGTYQEFKQ